MYALTYDTVGKNLLVMLIQAVCSIKRPTIKKDVMIPIQQCNNPVNDKF